METRPEQWKIDVNDRYRGVVDLLISLATGALLLPAVFLRSFLGVSEGEPVLMFLDWRAFLSLAAFALVIACGLCFHYTSVKWVKAAWGKPVMLQARSLEIILDLCFWIAALSFGIGVCMFLWFAIRG